MAASGVPMRTLQELTGHRNLETTLIYRVGVSDMQMGASQAKMAATLLKSLAGYVEGLIEAVVLDQDISMQQVQAAREAAKQPPGFA